ncbi:glycosyltransferase [Williamsia sterculiae]|uniref:UDP:flavonoid glycosyltransferase YjiC, YdhE family n=1 Tax=Williamsia sterculiae TaxID=1344003 RepID=A0A1N7DZH1_9NOCA|nr:glycosyltransferase [Williamsia sterculiae]SIR81262.1 UDP:flavonoid glycosyltransferase YjiC, YdhE family [Williamsia sterculiae]
MSPSNVVLAFNGSRGDVVPGLVVARALAGRGHRVTVGVPENLVAFARTEGVDAVPFAPDTDELLRSTVITRDLRSRNPRTRSRAVRQIAEFGATTMDDRLLEMADGTSIVMTGPLGQERGATVAESRGAAFVPLHFCPIRPNRSVPLPVPVLDRMAGLPLVTAALWRLVDLAYWQLSARRGDDTLRSRLGMPRARRPLGDRSREAGTPEIQAYDPVLFPDLRREWGDRRPMTGFLGAGGHPDDDSRLMSWLTAGPPPVYVGFGSMPLPDPRRTYGALVERLRDRGRRALVCAGPNHDAAVSLFDGSDDDVYLARSVDHTTVLPACAAAVHHGGAGTTGACLRAGIPMLIASFSADQPMWGRAVVDRGLGATCRIGRLDHPDVIDTVLRRTLDPVTAGRARTFAPTLIPPADAVRSVVDVLESLAC